MACGLDFRCNLLSNSSLCWGRASVPSIRTESSLLLSGGHLTLVALFARVCHAPLAVGGWVPGTVCIRSCLLLATFLAAAGVTDHGAWIYCL